MSKKHKHQTSEEMSWELESTLEPGMLRFMAHVMENGLNVGLRSEEDFIRHFSPMDIMAGLADRPDLRSNILVPATGVRAKIALKKSAQSAGEDLQIALAEGETTAELIVSLFHPDDRVRYLDKTRVWSFIIEPRFWTVERSKTSEFERAKTHMAFILDRAIEDRLLTHQEIVEGVTVASLVQYLPASDLQSVIETALANSHSGKPFTEKDLLNSVPSKKFVEQVPLSLIWESVIEPKVAVRNELVSPNASRGRESTSMELPIGESGNGLARSSGDLHHDEINPYTESSQNISYS